MEFGELASQAAVESLREFVAARRACEPETLRSGIEQANAQLVEKAAGLARNREPVQLGTTIVALLLSPDGRRASWGQVGDSRLYRMRGGRLTLLTSDHTRHGVAYRDSREVPLDLEHTSQLYQALGLGTELTIPTSSAEAQQGDLFLLCSDGISGALHHAALAYQLQRTGSLDDLARTLIDLAQEVSGRDNASAVLVRLTAS